MTTFTKEELLKIAHLSSLKLDEEEIPVFVNQIGAILEYVDQLGSIKISMQAEPVKNSNILRDDVAYPTNPKEIVNLAPQRQDDYFVVPKILDEK